MISVIIPFFNAKEFIVQAVNSCYYFDIVSEVIVIYDGCPNFSIFELVNLIGDIPKVKILSHDSFRNRGASSSRNLGILNSKCEFISFLDADDYYLPNRFDEFVLKLNSNKFFDGLYEAAKYNCSNRLFTINKPDIPPNLLFHYLIRGTYGHFCTNSIIVKKELLLQAGLFSEKLDMHEDSELWIKLAFLGVLLPGNISTPSSIIRRHSGNRVWVGTTKRSRFNMWKSIWKWSLNQRIRFFDRLLIARKLWKYTSVLNYLRKVE